MNKDALTEIELEGANPDEVYAWITECLKAGKVASAVALSFAAVNAFSDEPMVWLSHGRILNLLGATEQAVVAVERSLTLDETADGLILLSRLLAELKDRDAFNEVSEKVKAKYPARVGELPCFDGGC